MDLDEELILNPKEDEEANLKMIDENG